MRVRTKLIMLAVGATFLPAFLAAGYFFFMSRFYKGSFSPDANTGAYYEMLDKHRSSIDDFLAASRRRGPSAIGIGRDGSIIFSSGGGDDLSSILYSIGKGEGRAKPANGDLLSLWIQSFDVEGYGVVRMVAKAMRPSRNLFTDWLFLVSFTLLLFIAGFGLLIAQSLKGSLDRLGSEATRLAGGDLDTPIGHEKGEDVARLAQALEDLRLNLRREQARRSRLVMGVSHDFRTPISLIRGYADALKDRVAKDPATEERYLAVIKDKTGQLEALVDDLLAYVRMEGDQHRGEPPRVDMRAFFEGLASEFAEDAAIMERRFSFDVPTLDGVAVALDAAAARRAFRNLFTNAVHYTPRGGSIALEIENDGRLLSVSLVDDGIGIAPEDRDSIFEPFFRGKNSEGRGGSGLGLAVVKNVIESHGWRISCVSAPGAGARFTVAIPLPVDADYREPKPAIPQHNKN
jgi:signal transduction histidine kinase